MGLRNYLIEEGDSTNAEYTYDELAKVLKVTTPTVYNHRDLEGNVELKGRRFKVIRQEHRSGGRPFGSVGDSFRIRYFFSIPQDVKEEFEEYISNNFMDKNNLLEHLIRNYLESKKGL